MNTYGHNKYPDCTDQGTYSPAGHEVAVGLPESASPRGSISIAKAAGLVDRDIRDLTNGFAKAELSTSSHFPGLDLELAMRFTRTPIGASDSDRNEDEENRRRYLCNRDAIQGTNKDITEVLMRAMKREKRPLDKASIMAVIRSRLVAIDQAKKIVDDFRKSMNEIDKLLPDISDDGILKSLTNYCLGTADISQIMDLVGLGFAPNLDGPEAWSPFGLNQNLEALRTKVNSELCAEQGDSKVRVYPEDVQVIYSSVDYDAYMRRFQQDRSARIGSVAANDGIELGPDISLHEALSGPLADGNTRRIACIMIVARRELLKEERYGQTVHVEERVEYYVPFLSNAQQLKDVQALDGGKSLSKRKIRYHKRKIARMFKDGELSDAVMSQYRVIVHGGKNNSPLS